MSTNAMTEGKGPMGSFPSGSMSAWVVKLVILGLIDVLGIWAVSQALAEGWWLAVAFLGMVLVLTNLTYFMKGGLPFKYLLPGLIFLVAFQLYPAGYTFGASFTNYGTGHLQGQDAAVTAIITQTTRTVEDSPSFNVWPLESDGDISMLIEVPEDDAVLEGDFVIGTAEGTEPTTASGSPPAVDGYETLNLGQLAGDAGLDGQWQELAVPYDADEGFYLQAQSPTRASLVRSDLAYDAESDTFTNVTTEAVYAPNGDIGLYSTATCQEGQTPPGCFDSDLGESRQQADQFLTPGWPVFVGLDNYVKVFTDESIRNNFIPILLWSFVFAIGTVLMQFVFGLTLAMVMQDKRMRGQRFYRVFLILPYALPIFMTALVWRGMLNRDFGIINQILGGAEINWLGDPTLAKISLLVVNLWIGYSYMFLVVTGALTSIPGDLKEAAFVDGASGWKAFRTVVLPLLMVSVSPLLIASFAFNFNNFTLVDLLTEGGPFPGSPVEGGQTDLLITFTYRLAFGTNVQQLGFASAISMLIFFIVAGVSAYSFRLTKRLEEIKT